MVDHVFVTKQYAKLVGIIHGLLAIVYLPSGKLWFCGLLVLEAAAIILPGMLLTREDNAKIIARYMLTVSSISVVIIQCLSGSYEATVPLLLCIGALAALHFDPHLVLYSFAVNIVLFIAECVILSLQKGALAASVLTLAELFITLILACAIIISIVKTGCAYFEKSSAKQKESELLLTELDQKNALSQSIQADQKTLLIEIEQVANEISKDASSLSMQSETLANGATEQAASMEQLTGSMDEVCRHIKETSSYAQQMRENSEHMYAQVDTGSEHMSELLQAIHEIESCMQSISRAMKAIEDIAFQTNILALNAAVESARAGSAGKGFAVVADEVRRLATDSAQAANSTVKVLQDCRNAVEHGVSIADQTSEALEHIKSSVVEVKGQTVKISEMAASQLGYIDEMNDELGSVSRVVQSNAAASEESAGTVQAFTDQVHRLRALSQTHQSK